ncbi:MAG: APC family permease, partial [Thaumarchaeota archaeon]|nr:APC family permease [Nitrososphaerota archaeon]
VFNATVFTPAFYPDANPLVGPLIGLLLILPVAGMYALFSIAMPRTGGDYVWTSRTLNSGVGFTVNFSLTLLALSVIGSVSPWLSQWSFSPMFYDLGVLTSNSSFISLASTLNGTTATFWIAAVAILGTGAIVAGSTRLAGEIVKYWTIIAVAIGVIFVVVVLSAGNSTFISNFNAQYPSVNGTSAYNAVIAAGQAQYGSYPGVPPVLSQATLAAGALGLLGYLGFYYPAYFAGELKQNRRSQLLSQVGGSVIFMIFVTAIFAVAYFGEGPAFVNAIAGLWLIGSSGNPYPTIPLSSGLSLFWTHNTALVALFNIGFAGTIIVMFLSELFVLSRNIFAWSFDRVIPSTFASVNSKTRTPVNAVLLMVVVSLAYLYISVFNANDLTVLFSYGTAGTFIAFIFVAFAAIVYPYRRKDLFGSSSDDLAKRKIGGLPLITILGALSLVISIYVVYALLAPAIGGPTFGTVLEEGIGPTFILGAVIYIIAYAARRGQKIDLSLIAREIPPE